MKIEDIPPMGRVLLALGGTVLVGSVIAYLTEEDEPAREVRQRNVKRSKRSTKTKKVIVEIEDPETTSPSLSDVGSSPSEERKYPNEYYSLTKNQQYKYRQKLVKQLMEVAQQ